MSHTIQQFLEICYNVYKNIMTCRFTPHWHFQFLSLLYWTMLFLIFNYSIISILTLFRMVLLRAAHGWGGGGGKKTPTYISMMKLDSYALPKEDTKTILVTWNSPWVLLTSAFFKQKLENFAISKNTDIDSISIHNF